VHCPKPKASDAAAAGNRTGDDRQKQLDQDGGQPHRTDDSRPVNSTPVLGIAVAQGSRNLG